ncbi:hypothetical protein HBHAL_2343 [Halobacillus halophilus DSM 2266]|uniref:Uncharacterized protein n=1 Tax=Halobacillus halophilus (strain ATCC 35676 / DSM 2266 / JCM 20832 / KCTC 3685 / LMG 17431 / NBRC 102448 / NCIMB 2269) TaxID=866895 RepID=I0JKM0_HALH3|nr:DUF2651 family protein [Halobacillus halophilus]CCG44689.1 hypothetical protein HBHAL_2343 [Halobacillus halophilus DSM 2266]
MYVIPLVLFIFPMLAFVIGVLGRALLKKLFIAPVIVFGLSLLAQLLYLHFSFFTWTLIYTALAFSGSIIAHFLLLKYQPSRKVQKTGVIILLGSVLIPALIFTISRPVNAVLMEKKVENHLREEEYSSSDIYSIETFYDGKRNTNRTEPVIAEVVFTDDPGHTYRYIELKKKKQVVQMCEYERSPNFYTNEYTAERPHMVKGCFE